MSALFRCLARFLFLAIPALLSAASLRAQNVTFAGAQTTLASGLTGGMGFDLQGVAADSAGDLYFADSTKVQKLPWTGYSYGTETTVASGFGAVYGVAVDAQDNLYIADNANSVVVKLTPQGTQTTVISSLPRPTGLAVDTAGDLYVGVLGNDSVVEITPGGAQTTVASGATLEPLGVAVDGAGNIYIAYYNNTHIVKVAPGGAQTDVGSGLDDPTGVAVDSAGNVYVAEAGNGDLLEMTSAGAQTLLDPSGFSSPQGLAVDRAGNVYVADGQSGSLVEVQAHAVNFGAVNVCPSGQTTPSPCSQQLTLNYSFSGTETLGTPQALTLGAPGLDFTVVSGGTCTSGSTFASGAVCTMKVEFAPVIPGARNGVVELVDSSGNVLTTTYAYGLGQGPAVSFDPGTQQTLVTGLNKPSGIAVDGGGNLYIANASGGNLLELASGGSAPAQIGGLPANSIPNGIAVDGAGNLYLADGGVGEVLRIPKGCTSSTCQTVIANASTLSLASFNPLSIAVDHSGNVYFGYQGTSGPNDVTEAPRGCTAGSCYEPVATTGSDAPMGLAVDSSGSVYIAEGFGGLVQVSPAGPVFGAAKPLVAGSNGSSADGVAVDGAGNVYVANSSTSPLVYELPWTGSGFGPQRTIATGFQTPYGIAVSGNGNVYISDQSANQLVEDDRADAPSLNFANTPVSATSSDSPQTVLIENIGIGDLLFASATNPVYPMDFPENTSDTDLCSAGASLAPGATCYVSIDFFPSVPGYLMESVGVTDNNLNISNATQAIQVNGLSLSPTLTSLGTLYQNPSISYGQQVTLIAYVSAPVPGGQLPQPVGAVIFYQGSTVLGTGQLSPTTPDSSAGEFVWTAIPAGQDVLTAAYVPPQGSGFAGSSASLVLGVSPNSTSTTLSVSPNPAPSNQEVTLTATVTANGVAVSPGMVTFCDAAATYCEAPAVLGTAQLNSSGTASLKLLPGIGTYSIKAVFVGTNSASTSSSTPQPLTVTGTHPTTTTITSSGSPGNYTLVGTVTGSGDNATGPTGKVSFLDTSNGNAVLGSGVLGSSTLAQGFAKPAAFATGAKPNSVAVGDFNGDGKLDLAVTNFDSNSLSVLLGKGDGTFQTQVTYALGNEPDSVAVGDFNGDGNLDLTVGAGGAVAVLLGKGDGTFQSPATLASITAPGSVAVGDFNGDGNPDLVVTNADGNNLNVLLGNGDGTFQSPVTYATGSAPVFVVVGDFNGDGKLDLAAVNSNTPTVSVLLGNGDGTFQSQVTYATGALPVSAAAGDFNGDGKTDLVVANSADNTVSVLLSNSAGTFQSQVTYATGGVTPNSVAIGDFNSDGKLDLAVTNANGNILSILPGNGDGTFQSPATYSTGNTPDFVAVGDFNGDGKPDLAVANDADNTVGVFLDQVTQTATATLSNLSIQGNGTHNVDASYPGDANYGSSVSGTVPLAGSASFTSVTLNTLPQGLLVSVDGGVAQTTPFTVSWQIGSSHTIASTTPQTAPGTQYTFASWSDGGSISHMVSASASVASYTASFSTFYLLTTAANPSAEGTVSPASGSYYAAGTVVPLAAKPNAGDYFTGWTGPGTNVLASTSSASTTITMSAPESITAGFAPIPAYTVNTIDDDATGTPSNCTTASQSCTLRDALAAAGMAGAGNVTFDSTVFATAQTITLSNGPLSLPSNTTITGRASGSGAKLTNLVTVSGNEENSVVGVGSGVTNAAISTLNITGGLINGSYQTGAGAGVSNSGMLTIDDSVISGNGTQFTLGGGGIFNDTGAMLTVMNSTLSGNGANGTFFTGNMICSGGGGILNMGALTIVNSTIAGNSAGDCESGGGGILNVQGATLTLLDSTVSGNFDTNFPDSVINGLVNSSGGGILNQGTMTVTNSVVAGNTFNTYTSSPPTMQEDDCDGQSCPSNRVNGNVVTTNPMLGPLGNYGGPTQTMIPLPGSTAICAGVVADTPTGVITDQRGYPRTTKYGGTICTDSGPAQTNYALSFNTEPPASVPAKTNFTASLQLTENENPFPSSGIVIPLALAQGDNGSLNVTSVTTNSSGVAVANQLQVSAAGTGDKLVATLPLTTTPPPAPLTSSISISTTSSPFDVTAPAQTITFMQPASPVFYGANPITLEATATSGLPVTYSIVSGPGTVSGNELTITGAGTVVVAANQTGNANYAAAPQVTRTIVVNKATVTLTLAAAPANPVYGTPVTFTGTIAPAPAGATSSMFSILIDQNTPGAATLQATYQNSTVTVTDGQLKAAAHTVTLIFSGTANYAPATSTSVVVSVQRATPAITWSPASMIVYGTGAAALLNAAANTAGSFSYTAQAGGGSAMALAAATILPMGSYKLTASFAPADTADYEATSQTAVLTVTQATLTVTANNMTRVYGTVNPAFTGTVTGGVNGDTFTESFATAATLSSNAGTYAIVPAVTGTDLADYAVTVKNGTLTVTQAASSTVLTSSNTNTNLAASITFTATVVSSTTGVPTGSVAFLNGSALLGTSLLNAQGVATYTASTLAAGTQTINSVYTGDVNFLGSQASLSQLVTAPAYSLTATPSALSLNPGQTADVTLTLTPAGGFTGTIMLSCSGLPSGTSCSFSPAELTAGGTNTTETAQMTIKTAGPDTGTVSQNRVRGSNIVPAALFMLPGALLGGFLGWQRRKLSRELKYLVFAAMLVSTLSGMVGCGSSTPMTPATPAGTYKVTVTATAAGTASGYSGPAAEMVTLTITVSQ